MLHSMHSAAMASKPLAPARRRVRGLETALSFAMVHPHTQVEVLIFGSGPVSPLFDIKRTRVPAQAFGRTFSLALLSVMTYKLP
jgi:hypothetical protein